MKSSMKFDFDKGDFGIKNVDYQEATYYVNGKI